MFLSVVTRHVFKFTSYKRSLHSSFNCEVQMWTSDLFVSTNQPIRSTQPRKTIQKQCHINNAKTATKNSIHSSKFIKNNTIAPNIYSFHKVSMLGTCKGTYIILKGLCQCRLVSIITRLGFIGIQLPEKYKENVDVLSEGSIIDSLRRIRGHIRECYQYNRKAFRSIIKTTI